MSLRSSRKTSVKAHQTIYADKDHPSALVVPVVPR